MRVLCTLGYHGPCCSPSSLSETDIPVVWCWWLSEYFSDSCSGMMCSSSSLFTIKAFFFFNYAMLCMPRCCFLWISGSRSGWLTDTAAPRHLLQHPDVPAGTCVWLFTKGNGPVAVYPNTFLLFLSSFPPPPIILFPVIILLCCLAGPLSTGYLCSVIGSFTHFSIWRWCREARLGGNVVREMLISEVEGGGGTNKSLKGKGRFYAHVCVPWAGTCDVTVRRHGPSACSVFITDVAYKQLWERGVGFTEGKNIFFHLPEASGALLAAVWLFRG